MAFASRLNPNDRAVPPSCRPLPPSFLPNSSHGYPFVSNPSALSWIALERKRLRNLHILGQNNYPFSYNITRTFKGTTQDVPLACSTGDKAEWRTASGKVLHPIHKHIPRSYSAAPSVRSPNICDIGDITLKFEEPVKHKKGTNKFITPQATNLVAQVNPESWRTNFYIPFSTLEPKATGDTEPVPPSPRRQRMDIPPVDIARWQTFAFDQAKYNKQPRSSTPNFPYRTQ